MKAQPYRLLERSIFCDRMVFVESLKDSKIMSEMELSIYNSWCHLPCFSSAPLSRVPFWEGTPLHVGQAMSNIEAQSWLPWGRIYVQQCCHALPREAAE